MFPGGTKVREVILERFHPVLQNHCNKLSSASEASSTCRNKGGNADESIEKLSGGEGAWRRDTIVLVLPSLQALHFACEGGE